MKYRPSQEINADLSKETNTNKMIQFAQELLRALAAEDAERKRANDSEKPQAA